MTTKAHRLIPQILAAILTLFGAAACSTTTASAPAPAPQAEANEPPTVFKCIQQGSGWATTAEKDNLTTKTPLITWDSKEFGPEYTPEKRCKIVSEKLTQAVKNNGGDLGLLKLKVGSLNNQKVVCVIDAPTSCNSDNTLFTLNKENSDKPEQALHNIFKQYSEGRATGSKLDQNASSDSILLKNLVNLKPFNKS